MYQSSGIFHWNSLLGKAVEQSALRRLLLTPKEMLPRIKVLAGEGRGLPKENLVLPKLCITDNLTDERNVMTLADWSGV